MKGAYIFIYFLTISQTLSLALATLEDTCKKVAGSDFKFCVTSLQAIPSSQAADAKGLALIATNLTIANYTHNLAKVRELMSSAQERLISSPQVEVALNSCLASYAVGVSDLMSANAKIEAVDIDGALVNLSEAWKRPIECEDAFKKSGMGSLLVKEDGFASRLVTLALKITVLIIS
ncbi:uncharacterized protein A4U43_C06F3300 [Asparagus officinalis]|uniref:Pectinesterase inhibitor domain-containing protein n=1 Tax=Asparagus officinalis TaxID=4686 RepID=A0A5P1EJ77_ASPOF|nr:cell wall / vacuolar inhibitor of fructosidase 2-like [Asparagus officinalis]ONK66015.1 uncharacterized protein A4U43_C06F3300 [Asparagus officinalis]